MSTRLLVPGEVYCIYENSCRDRKYQNCSKCRNNSKNITREVKRGFFSLIKERG